MKKAFIKCMYEAYKIGRRVGRGEISDVTGGQYMAKLVKEHFE